MSALPSSGDRPTAATTRRALQGLVLTLLGLLLWVLLPVSGALLIGGFAVLVSYGPYQRLLVHLKGCKTLAALLATVALSLMILVPMGIGIVVGVGEATDGIHWVSGQLSTGAATRTLQESLPPRLREYLPTWEASLRSALPVVTSALPRVLASGSRLFINALLAIVTIFYLLRDGDALVVVLRRVSPLRDDQTSTLLAEFRTVALALFRGNVVVGLFQGLAAGAAYAFVGVSHVFLLALVTAAASFIPVVGTALVWLPVAAVVALQHHTLRAVVLLLWCATVVGLGDNLLRPFVSKGHMALPRLLVFLTLFGGLQMFGLQGLLLGPLLGSLAVTAVNLLAKPVQGDAPSDPTT